MTFYEWLMKQTNRSDSIGTFAGDVECRAIPGYPKWSLKNIPVDSDDLGEWECFAHLFYRLPNPPWFVKVAFEEYHKAIS